MNSAGCLVYVAVLVLLFCAMQLILTGHIWAGSSLFSATVVAYWLCLSWTRRKERTHDAVRQRLRELAD